MSYRRNENGLKNKRLKFKMGTAACNFFSENSLRLKRSE